jgi:hypothetical protein
LTLKLLGPYTYSFIEMAKITLILNSFQKLQYILLCMKYVTKLVQKPCKVHFYNTKELHS